MFNNPTMMAQMEQMMQNPEIQKMMSDPNILNNLGNMMNPQGNSTNQGQDLDQGQDQEDQDQEDQEEDMLEEEDLEVPIEEFEELESTEDQ
jgi:hypothetical protein